MIVVVMTAAMLFSSSAFVEGQVLVQAKAEAARLASHVQLQPQQAGGSSRAMLWAGLALIGAGATVAVLGATGEDCASIFGIEACISNTNQALLWTGVGIAGAGAGLTIAGARPSLIRGGIVVERPFGF